MASVTELINFCNQGEVISVTGGPEVRHLMSMVWVKANCDPHGIETPVSTTKIVDYVHEVTRHTTCDENPLTRDF